MKAVKDAIEEYTHPLKAVIGAPLLGYLRKAASHGYRTSGDDVIDLHRASELVKQVFERLVREDAVTDRERRAIERFIGGTDERSE